MSPALRELPRQSDLSDEEILARVRDGDHALFAVLMRRHNPRLFRTVRAIVRDDADAEDALQQAYIAAFASAAGFRGDSRVGTWLTRIAINEALGRLRQRRPHGDLALVAEQEHPMPDPHTRVAGHEVAVIAEQAIDALPDGYRVVFTLREIEELTTAETAAALGLTEEAVRVRLHRARGLLRASLDERFGGAAERAFAFAGERCDRIVQAVAQKLGLG